eukprot:scpid15639/ scgid32089/ 
MATPLFSPSFVLLFSIALSLPTVTKQENSDDCGENGLCPLIPNSTNIHGHLIYSSRAVGGTATLACQDGFRPAQGSTFVCTRQAAGTREGASCLWTGARFACNVIAAYCPMLDIPQGSVSSQDASVGSVVRVDCDAGYQRSGALYLTCNAVTAEAGRWSSNETICSEIDDVVVPRISGVKLAYVAVPTATCSFLIMLAFAHYLHRRKRKWRRSRKGKRTSIQCSKSEDSAPVLDSLTGKHEPPLFIIATESEEEEEPCVVRNKRHLQQQQHTMANRSHSMETSAVPQWEARATIMKDETDSFTASSSDAAHASSAAGYISSDEISSLELMSLRSSVFSMADPSSRVAHACSPMQMRKRGGGRDYAVLVRANHSNDTDDEMLGAGAVGAGGDERRISVHNLPLSRLSEGEVDDDNIASQQSSRPSYLALHQQHLNGKIGGNGAHVTDEAVAAAEATRLTPVHNPVHSPGRGRRKSADTILSCVSTRSQRRSSLHPRVNPSTSEDEEQGGRNYQQPFNSISVHDILDGRLSKEQATSEESPACSLSKSAGDLLNVNESKFSAPVDRTGDDPYQQPFAMFGTYRNSHSDGNVSYEPRRSLPSMLVKAGAPAVNPAAVTTPTGTIDDGGPEQEDPYQEPFNTLNISRSGSQQYSRHTSSSSNDSRCQPLHQPPRHRRGGRGKGGQGLHSSRTDSLSKSTGDLVRCASARARVNFDVVHTPALSQSRSAVSVSRKLLSPTTSKQRLPMPPPPLPSQLSLGPFDAAAALAAPVILRSDAQSPPNADTGEVVGHNGSAEGALQFPRVFSTQEGRSQTPTTAAIGNSMTLAAAALHISEEYECPVTLSPPEAARGGEPKSRPQAMELNPAECLAPPPSRSTTPHITRKKLAVSVTNNPSLATAGDALSDNESIGYVKVDWEDRDVRMREDSISDETPLASLTSGASSDVAAVDGKRPVYGRIRANGSQKKPGKSSQKHTRAISPLGTSPGNGGASTSASTTLGSSNLSAALQRYTSIIVRRHKHNTAAAANCHEEPTPQRQSTGPLRQAMSFHSLSTGFAGASNSNSATTATAIATPRYSSMKKMRRGKAAKSDEVKRSPMDGPGSAQYGNVGEAALPPPPLRAAGKTGIRASLSSMAAIQPLASAGTGAANPPPSPTYAPAKSSTYAPAKSFRGAHSGARSLDADAMIGSTAYGILDDGSSGGAAGTSSVTGNSVFRVSTTVDFLDDGSGGEDGGEEDPYMIYRSLPAQSADVLSNVCNYGYIANQARHYQEINRPLLESAPSSAAVSTLSRQSSSTLSLNLSSQAESVDPVSQLAKGTWGMEPLAITQGSTCPSSNADGSSEGSYITIQESRHSVLDCPDTSASSILPPAANKGRELRLVPIISNRSVDDILHEDQEWAAPSVTLDTSSAAESNALGLALDMYSEPVFAHRPCLSDNLRRASLPELPGVPSAAAQPPFKVQKRSSLDVVLDSLGLSAPKPNNNNNKSA